MFHIDRCPRAQISGAISPQIFTCFLTVYHLSLAGQFFNFACIKMLSHSSQFSMSISIIKIEVRVKLKPASQCENKLPSTYGKLCNLKHRWLPQRTVAHGNVFPVVRFHLVNSSSFVTHVFGLPPTLFARGCRSNARFAQRVGAH